jgi:hypothetical protein
MAGEGSSGRMRRMARRSPVDEKRRRRERRRIAKRTSYETVDIGAGLVTASPAAVMRALERLSDLPDWERIAPDVVPIFPRRMPLPEAGGTPLQVLLPPGVSVGFGLDLGPAFVHLSVEVSRQLGVSELDIVARALENLRRRAEIVRRRDVAASEIDGVAARILVSGTGCASAFVLLPDELERIFGPDPALLVAPMRDLVIAFPGDVDRGLAADVRDTLAQADPNGLALEGFRLDRGVIACEVLGETWARA